MDVGCYCVSGSRLLAGEPESVYGQAWIGETGTDWVFARRCASRAGCLRSSIAGTALVKRDELEAMGSEGSIFLDDPWHCRAPRDRAAARRKVERIELVPVDSYRLELENLSDAIRGEGELLLGREDAVAQARVMEALQPRRLRRAGSTRLTGRRRHRLAQVAEVLVPRQTCLTPESARQSAASGRFCASFHCWQGLPTSDTGSWPPGRVEHELVEGRGERC